MRGFLFEPVAKYAGVCRDRFAGDDMVEVIQCALGDEDCERTIYKAAHNYGANSLVTEIMFDRRPNSTVRPETVIEEEVIQLRSVSSWLNERGLRHVDVIKSDTEGYDYAVLNGLKPWIQETGCYPALHVEVLDEEYHPLVAEQTAALESFVELGYGAVDLKKELNWIVGDVLLLPTRDGASG